MIDLELLRKQLDGALAKETPESMNEWLDRKINEENSQERSFFWSCTEQDLEDPFKLRQPYKTEFAIPSLYNTIYEPFLFMKNSEYIFGESYFKKFAIGFSIESRKSNKFNFSGLLNTVSFNEETFFKIAA